MRKLASRTNLRLCPRQTVMRWILPVLSTALIAVGTYVAFSRSLTRARARLAGRSDMVETSFGAMEYAVMGEGEPVLSIHGAAGGFDQTLDMTGALAGRGYRLIAPSRFGYLRSSMPDQPTVAMQADAYAELLDRLGVHGAVVVGISAGAWLCLQFAIRHPGRSKALVLLVPASALPKGVRIRGRAFARHLQLRFRRLGRLETDTDRAGRDDEDDARDGLRGAAQSRAEREGTRAPNSGSSSAGQPAHRRDELRRGDRRRARIVSARKDYLPCADDQRRRRHIWYRRSGPIHRRWRTRRPGDHLSDRRPRHGRPPCRRFARNHIVPPGDKPGVQT